MSSLIERADAFEQACHAHELTALPTVELSFPDGVNGRTYARRLLASREFPDAIACANDELAFGILAELRSAGVRCPEDILIVGYDDIPASEYLDLTTISQPLQDKGREAARLLQHESNSPRHVRLTPTLIPRGTTRPNRAQSSTTPPLGRKATQV